MSPTWVTPFQSHSLCGASQPCSTWTWAGREADREGKRHLWQQWHVSGKASVYSRALCVVWEGFHDSVLKGYSELQLHLFFTAAVLFSWGFSTQSEETLHLENYQLCSWQQLFLEKQPCDTINTISSKPQRCFLDNHKDDSRDSKKKKTSSLGRDLQNGIFPKEINMR